MSADQILWTMNSQQGVAALVDENTDVNFNPAAVVVNSESNLKLNEISRQNIISGSLQVSSSTKRRRYGTFVKRQVLSELKGNSDSMLNEEQAVLDNENDSEGVNMKTLAQKSSSCSVLENIANSGKVEWRSVGFKQSRQLAHFDDDCDAVPPDGESLDAQNEGQSSTISTEKWSAKRFSTKRNTFEEYWREPSDKMLTSNQVIEKRSWNLNDFDMDSPVMLGKGKFGLVYRVKEVQSGEYVAIKVLSKSHLLSNPSTNIMLLRREVEIQSRLAHPHCLQLYGYFLDEKNIFLILEEARQELYKLMHKSGGKIEENLAAKYIKQTASALAFLKSLHVIHRDIKPENLLIGRDNFIKLSDFGWSCHAPSPMNYRRTLCGTPEYVAPEMLIEKLYDHTVDNWALGVLSYEIVLGKSPFYVRKNVKSGIPDSKVAKKKLNQAIFERVKSYRDNTLFKDSPERLHLSNDFCDFVSSLIRKNPKSRTSMEVAQSHTWIVDRSS